MCLTKRLEYLSEWGDHLSEVWTQSATYRDFQQSDQKGSSQITRLKKIMPRANSTPLPIHRWAKPNGNLFFVHRVWHFGLCVSESTASAATAVGTVIEVLMSLTIHR